MIIYSLYLKRNYRVSNIIINVIHKLSMYDYYPATKSSTIFPSQSESRCLLFVLFLVRNINNDGVTYYSKINSNNL